MKIVNAQQFNFPSHNQIQMKLQLTLYTAYTAAAATLVKVWPPNDDFYQFIRQNRNGETFEN